MEPVIQTTETDLEEQLVNRLISRGWHISCAESCTGGLLAAGIVNVANASRVLTASFVTYAEEAKMRYAHVSEETLKRFGVVSKEVAAEMASGVALETSAEVGVGITGLAGPGGGTKELPVGTVCFGFFVNGTVTTRTMHFGSIGRNEVRKEAVRFALQTLLELS
ncbi:MAG: CinA family protein [Lachnospiraceae bacterium]